MMEIIFKPTTNLHNPRGLVKLFEESLANVVSCGAGMTDTSL